ncbi:DNA-3-methyladenine glycosylase family protein [Chitinophaga vietnamensis]|uniref:DNA-3-methyladenine glycosylase family protein n=1 Tax=Chitinophaga vietnamensis TaxID=2593957 RepID=UPI001177B8D5|nr:DNA-3-methyladenine glycosylase [Chitinophaga vietnamensis]
MDWQKIIVEVSDPENFSFRECLYFLGRSDKECLHYIRGNTLQKMILAGDTPALLHIADTGKGALEVMVRAADNTPVDAAGIRDYVSRWLDLGMNLQAFYNYSEGDTLLRGLPQRYKGLRLVGIPDLFEAITWTIIGQQINLAFAYTLRQRFIQAFGHHEKIDGTDYYLYPHPAVVAALPPEALLPMQFSRGKAAYIINTAQQMASGQLSAAMFATLPYEAAKEKLLALKGIGNWSANYVLMKYKRFPQALPLEDAGLHNAIRHRLQLDAKPTPAQLQTYTGRWQQHAAYATFYLWRSLLSQ